MSNVITQESLDGKLNSPDNLVNILKVRYEKFNKGGRKEGSVELSPSLRAIAGATALLTTAKAAGKTLGVSPIVAHLAKKALINSDGRTHVDRETKERLEDIKDNIIKKAVDTIITTFDLLPSKLEGTKARDLSGIAKDSASIIEKLSEKNHLNGVTVIIEQPRVKELREFEVIDIKPVDSDRL